MRAIDVPASAGFAGMASSYKHAMRAIVMLRYRRFPKRSHKKRQMIRIATLGRNNVERSEHQEQESSAMDVSKTKTSFYRRLYVAWLIDSGTACSVPALMSVTGMPRRTAQDTLAALEELDIDCTFEQAEGARNNAGHYVISNWGPIDKQWVEHNLQQIRSMLGYP